jgi:putative redox protein
MIPERTVVATIGLDRYNTTLETATHVLMADEPATKGGTDKGPEPNDFLRMSLASCKAITLRMYADRKKWDVQKIHVTVSTEYQEGKTILVSTLEITGNINDVQRKRLLEIAEACPVHKVLAGEIELKTLL